MNVGGEEEDSNMHLTGHALRDHKSKEVLGHFWKVFRSQIGVLSCDLPDLRAGPTDRYCRSNEKVEWYLHSCYLLLSL